MVNFSEECSVLFFFSDGEGTLLRFNYERPQIIDDVQLNQEAESNAQDMIDRNLNGAKELIAIGIARSKKQHDEIINQVESELGLK